MVKLLTEDKKDILIKLDDLIQLRDAIPSAGEAQRDINQQIVQNFIYSDPKQWPKVLLTSTDKGYILIDGRHRRAAAAAREMTELRATVKTFKNQNDIIEAAYQANLHNGLAAGAETRSAYAYWLFVTYPDLTQEEIAGRAEMDQSSVSRAIRRREARDRAATGIEEQETEVSREKQIRKRCRTVTRTVLSLFKEMDEQELDDRDIMLAFNAVLTREEDRANVARIARLLAESVQPRRLRAVRSRKKE